MQPTDGFTHDVVVIGGCGHVGLPLAIAFADRGAVRRSSTTSASARSRTVNDGALPFDEPGRRRQAHGGRRVRAAPGVAPIPRSSASAEHVVVVIGTPVDEHLNPDPQAVPRALEGCSTHFRDGQLLVLRSTVYPGVTAMVERLVSDLGRRRSTSRSAPSASPRARR